MVVPLNVQHAAVVGVHHERAALLGRFQPKLGFHRQGVARVHHHIATFHEVGDVLCGDAILVNVDVEVRVKFGNGPCRHHPLGQFQFVQSAPNAVQVGEFDDVKICQLQPTASTFHGQGHGRALAYAQTGNAHRLSAQRLGLFTGDLVAVAVGSHLDEGVFREHMDQPPGPRVEGPHPKGVPIAICHERPQRRGEQRRVVLGRRGVTHRPFRHLGIEGVVLFEDGSAFTQGTKSNAVGFDREVEQFRLPEVVRGHNANSPLRPRTRRRSRGVVNTEKRTTEGCCTPVFRPRNTPSGAPWPRRWPSCATRPWRPRFRHSQPAFSSARQAIRTAQ